MPYTISPFFRSPWTDLTGGMISHQLHGRCATREMDMMDCLEAYGLDRGMRKCKDLIEEFKECHTLTLQFKRFYAMRAERERQIAEGKLKGECRYVTPKIDSF
ncbi:NADH dehydrogenase [ubiquinone] iron-sulfur protein 5-like [Cydia amplana]|uniref:NADH dehydrogenase [ubiquinone] iron-sulfur protein 5-like n=1 Tax=Cydia amplana TaxID=1869771 RepID=UPI002FE520E1